MQGNVLGQSGAGSKIKGLIEEYQVADGEEIKAGDLVKYINEYEEDTQLGNLTKSYGTDRNISAVKLNEKKMFVAQSFQNQNTTNGSNYLYGMVITINGKKIISGNDIQLSSSKYSGTSFSIVKLNENKVFIAYSNNDNYFVHGIIATINGTNIIIENDAPISGQNSSSGYTISTIKINENKIFIIYYNNRDYYLHGIIVTIEGVNIVIESDILLEKGFNGSNPSLIKLSEDKIFIVYYVSGYYLYGMIVTINGKEITIDTNIMIKGMNGPATRSNLIKNEENRIFILYSYTPNRSAEYYLYGMIVTINGKEIEKNIDTQLSLSEYSGKSFFTIELNKREIFIAYSYSNNYYLYGMTIISNDLEITIKKDEQLSTIKYSGNSIYIVQLYENSFIIFHFNYDENTFAPLYAIYKCSFITKKTKEILGLAKTSGKSGDTIKVIVPNYEEEEGE